MRVEATATLTGGSLALGMFALDCPDALRALLVPLLPISNPYPPYLRPAFSRWIFDVPAAVKRCFLDLYSQRPGNSFRCAFRTAAQSPKRNVRDDMNGCRLRFPAHQTPRRLESPQAFFDPFLRKLETGNRAFTLQSIVQPRLNMPNG